MNIIKLNYNKHGRPMEPPEGPDYYTPRGAHALAAKINEYWIDRGYRGIKARAVRMEKDPAFKRQRLYFVTSNIGPNGYPPKEADGGR